MKKLLISLFISLVVVILMSSFLISVSHAGWVYRGGYNLLHSFDGITFLGAPGDILNLSISRSILNVGPQQAVIYVDREPGEPRDKYWWGYEYLFFINQKTYYGRIPGPNVIHVWEYK